MDAEEKMTALKKAYADILLNISKEAAARVMSSERKAMQYQHELKIAKDEALRMLLRLKQMMDSKISEAEAASLSQQSKIDELEAQLQEAEDIVKDLREELGEAQSELERVKKDNSHRAKEPDNNASPTETNARVHSYQDEAAIASYISNRDLTPSIISRGKKPGLYRNGCTQRIRACERNSLGKDFCSSQETDKVKDSNNNSNNKREDEEGEDKVLPHKTITLSELEKKLMAGSNCQSFLQKKKRAARLRKVVKCSSGNIHVPVSDKDGAHSRTAPIMSLDSLGEESNVEESFGGSVLQKDEGLEEKISSTLDCKVDHEKLDTPEANSSQTTEVLPRQSVRERVIKYTFQRKRKREALNGAEANTTVETEKTEKETGEKKAGDQKSELSKSSLLTESSRESRRLAQVARQLISLSEKKWWH